MPLMPSYSHSELADCGCVLRLWSLAVLHCRRWELVFLSYVSNTVPAWRSSSREQRVFFSQVLSNIRLPKCDDASRVQLPCLRRRSCAHTEALGPVSTVQYTVAAELLTSGVSFMLNTTTPWCSGQSSLHLPTCALSTFPP